MIHFNESMEYDIQIIVLILLIVIITWLISLLLKSGKHRAEYEIKSEVKTRLCPLCSTPLKQGERVHSIVYPGKPDKMMEIHGCPYCRKGNGSVERICPVCKRIIDPEGYVIARMFDNGLRKHVHVLGCTTCYTRH